MVEFTLNGEAVIVEDDSTPLVFVLRNVLQLKSPKLGCGLEQCGSCAILVNGEARMSCRMPAAVVADAVVETVEGLRSPVQAALEAFNATQCGYCLSGVIIAAEALFRRNAAPSRAQIAEALDGHLCRCGAHPRVLRALTELSGTRR